MDDDRTIDRWVDTRWYSSTSSSTSSPLSFLRRFTRLSRRSQVGAVRQHERVDIHRAEF